MDKIESILVQRTNELSLAVRKFDKKKHTWIVVIII